MTDQELVQAALTRLPRPTPPPRLRRAVMAQIRAEAQTEAAGQQAHVWLRTEGDGWATEWRQGNPPPRPAGSIPMPPHTVLLTERRQDAAGTTIIVFTQTQ